MCKLISAAITLALLIPDFGKAQEANVTVNGRNVSLDTWRPPKHVAKKFPYYVSGYDYENRPIYIIEMGKWDLRTIIEKGGKDFEDLELHFLQMLYRIGQAGTNLRNGEERGSSTVASIIDYDNYDLLQLTSAATVKFFLKHTAGFQRIQDVIAYSFYINVNSVAAILASLTKPILGRVFERVEIFGTQKYVWIPQLLRKIPRSQLPPWYGGEKDYKPVAFYG